MDSLQFQKAEYASGGPPCAACKTPIQQEYFQLAGSNICPACAAKARANQARPSHATVMRGLLYGAGAAVICSVVYASIILITGMGLGLIAVAVGYLVGRAVRTGSRGLGGRRWVAAVALTYLAITFGYVPVIVQQMGKDDRAKQAAQKDKAPQAARPASSVGMIAVGLVVLTGIAMVAPILNLMSGVGGILGVVIIGVGLLQAWKLTARDERLLVGPYQREEAAPFG
ncbi:MAG: hypothetical protein ABI811_05805 [Acidobacteriota bacterium]